MRNYVNVNMIIKIPIIGLLNVIIAALGGGASYGQEIQTTSAKKIDSFEKLLNRPVRMRKELKNVHPRIFFTNDDLPALRKKAVGEGNEQWNAFLGGIKTLTKRPPNPNDEDLYKSGLDKRKKGSVTQYEMAFQISQTSFAYAMGRKEDYLKAAKEWTLAACAMPFWGYTYNKPNVDLPPAHLLYAVAFAYDVLYDELSSDERKTIKTKLIVQSRLMYDYFKHKPNKRYSYSQNHTWIPISGLAIAAYALIDEVEEASEWAALSRAIFDRTMLTFAHDGYFYESIHYFAMIDGGVPIAEITLTTPNALVEMDSLSNQYGDKLLIGAGTVLDTDSARKSYDSGAEFIVTPYLNVDVIEHCVKTGIPVFAGSLTPTEVYTAFSAGADLIKVFPASAMGGAKYLKALKGPFPNIELMPTGGVNLETAESFLQAGAYALGVGGDMAPASINSDEDLEKVRKTARQYLDIIQKFRASDRD